QVLAPYVRGKKGEYRKQLEQMGREGFVRARIDGEIVDLSGELPKLNKRKKHTIDIVVDRLVVKAGLEKRLAQSLETALSIADGLVILAPVDDGFEEALLSKSYACTRCGFQLPEVSPRLFSFNSPYGACSECAGLGSLMRVDPDKLVLEPTKSIRGGAVAPWKAGSQSYQMQKVENLAEALDFSLDVPWDDLPEDARNTLLYGSGDQEIEFTYTGQNMTFQHTKTYEGLVPRLQRRHSETDSTAVRSEIEKYMSIQPCPSCHGRRLRPEALAVKIDGHAIDVLEHLPVDELLTIVRGLELSDRQRQIVAKVLQEIRDRLGFLANVGVGYLTLDRSAGTLSGGESQRIRLATQIGSKLMGVLYVLDEPSIGLHQRDNERLIDTLQGMRDLGNSVLVVEHDEETIRAADYVLDLGPGAGVHGGEVVAKGTPAEIAGDPDSPTGRYLSGAAEIAIPERRERDPERMVWVRGARHNNLKDIDIAFPLGLFTVVTGVSGSGKSSLVNDILHKALDRHFFRAVARPGEHAAIEGLDHLDKVIAIDQSPIGRTPRSNPATYTNVFTPIRELMAKTPEARARGYKAGRFSFNVSGGRCEACKGDGQNKIEMHFLPDIYVTCEICAGKRYDRETLQVQYKGLNIAEILALTVEQALEVFANIPKIHRVLQTIYDVGLGYIRLGQPATTLSGGEAQRVKLATELAKRSTGRTLYLLDEPTTGLHFQDVEKLLEVLHRLVEKGNTVIVVEHNLEVVKTADWLIDLGPEGGAGGGRLVAAGPPEAVAKVEKSHTGRFLKPILNRAAAPA
ncbi:MAG: excinuclease ABC subunit UvrA, partial [Acidobacteriota bacterium]